jgi:hypothetical protein
MSHPSLKLRMVNKKRIAACLPSEALAEDGPSKLERRTSGGGSYLDVPNNVFTSPHQESNLDLRFRKPPFYPLNYGEQ